MHRKDFLLLLLKRIDNNFQLVAIKASLILPADILLLDLLLNKGPETGTTGVSIARAAQGLAIFAVLLSIIFAVNATLAFLKSGKEKTREGSPMFFGSIAGMDLKEFQQQLHELDTEKEFHEISQQVHALSDNLLSKFRNVNKSIFLLLAAAVLASLRFIWI